jgi:hypothetical protein
MFRVVSDRNRLLPVGPGLHHASQVGAAALLVTLPPTCPRLVPQHRSLLLPAQDRVRRQLSAIVAHHHRRNAAAQFGDAIPLADRFIVRLLMTTPTSKRGRFRGQGQQMAQSRICSDFGTDTDTGIARAMTIARVKLLVQLFRNTTVEERHAAPSAGRPSSAVHKGMCLQSCTICGPAFRAVSYLPVQNIVQPVPHFRCAMSVI